MDATMLSTAALPGRVAVAANDQEPQPVDATGLLRRLRRAGLWALGLWLTGFVAWAVFAPISGAVIGGGLVKVEANRQSVSHRDGGTVAKVLVREGQLVTRGQPLIVLEDARLDSSVDLLDAQLAAEQLRKSRLAAEVALQSSWTPPKTSAATDAERVREAMSRERSAFDARRRTLQGQLESVRSQVLDTETELLAHQRDRTASGEALRLLREELKANEALLEQNFVNRTRVMTLQRGVSEYESRIQASEAEFAKARQKRTELEGRLVTVKDAYVQTAAEELREVTAKAVDLEERLRASRDTAGRQVVTAPSDGRLVDLKVNTPGSAVGPREPIVDIVPSDVPLVVEARIAADAISDIRPGLTAEVKLMSYRQRNAKLLEGKVVYVSADALVEQRSGAPYFAVQVEVAPASLAEAGQLVLLPGMAAEVYIKTSERTPLEFLLEPLTASLRKSFREH
jgi:epimerase transport system membrane fusion protein